MTDFNTITIDVRGLPGWVWDCRVASSMTYLIFDHFTRTTTANNLRLADWGGAPDGIIVLKEWKRPS